MKATIYSVLLFLVVSVFAAYDGWSEPVMVADGTEFTNEYDKPHFALDLDGNYVIVHRRWRGNSDVFFTKIDQAGNVLVEPTPISTTDDTETLPVCVVTSDNTIHVFFMKVDGSYRNVHYAHLSSEGQILEGPKLFVETLVDSGYIMLAITKEPDDTIHIAYADHHGDPTNLLGYTRWNPITDERLDVWEIEVIHPNVYGQHLDDNWDIEVDSEGNAHLFFDQALDFNWMNPTVEEVCWAKVPYDSEGEYESKILSRFMVDNFDDWYIRADIDDNDVLQMFWSGVLDTERNIIHYSMDTDGNEVTPYKHVLPQEWLDVISFMDVKYNNGNIAMLITTDDYRFALGYLDENGDIIGDFEYITDANITDKEEFNFIHHNNGFINIVWHWEYDLWYQYTLDGFAADDPNLNAFSAADGILLSWREEGDLVGSSWRLERDGDRLVNLSGDALYRYLDRGAEPNVTHLYTLEATLPDGSIRRFGPVEATWSGPDADRLTLYAPYPCPATDQVTLSYYLPEDTTNVELSLYDLSGRLVASSISFSTAPGRHEVVYDTSALPSGVYVARLTADASSITKRLIIAR